MDKVPVVYILASKPRGTTYIGVTSNLQHRVWQHKQGLVEGFTNQHHVHQLVYFEVCPTMHAAIEREKQLKNWKRSWKVQLVEVNNNRWDDLYLDLF